MNNLSENRSVITRRFAWLSIGAAVSTIALKATAYSLTGSVGLLSDALESTVNLVGAAVTLAMLILAARPADEEHMYGHSKAEYFSSGAEGMMIVVAAVLIAVSAVQRLLSPVPLDRLDLGLMVSVVATAINFGVAMLLLRAGKRYESISLEADAKHLLTDVITSVGVVCALVVVSFTGWQWLDPIVALLLAAQILRQGVELVRRSMLGLLDTALPEPEQKRVQAVINQFDSPEIKFHALRTRQAGMRRFVSMHVLVPGTWTVQHGHQLLESIEAGVRATLPHVTVFTHLESLDDTASYDDTSLDRDDASLDRGDASLDRGNGRREAP